MLKLIRLVCALFITSGLVTAAADESLLRDAIGADYDYLAGLFEHFHRHPELSYREEETARRLARDTHQVHVVLEGLAGRFVGSLEERPHVHVETEIREGRGDHLLAAIVAVLSHLCHQNTGPAPFTLREGFDP